MSSCKSSGWFSRSSRTAATGSAPGTDRVLGIGMDSTEYGVNPLSFAPAYRAAAAAGLRRTGHQGENSPAAAIGVVAVGLGAERIDHGLSLVDDPDLIAFFATAASR